MVITVVETRILLGLYSLPAEADINRQILLFVALSKMVWYYIACPGGEIPAFGILIHTFNILYVIRYMCTEVWFNLQS